MTDSNGRPVEGEQPSRGPGYRKDTKNIPPLVWIVIALLVVVAIIAFANWRSTHVTPHGGTMPAASETNVAPPLSSTPGAVDGTTSG